MPCAWIRAAGVECMVGDRAGFSTRFQRQGRTIFAKALDDRLGVATLIELLKHAPANIDLLAAFTVQEEVGLRGATVAAHALAPDIAIALDATAARDLPAHDGRENTVYNAKLGLGPAIYIEAVHDRRLVKHFVDAGDAGRIPYQVRQPGGSGNDASAMQQGLARHPGAFHLRAGSLPAFTRQLLPRGRLAEHPAPAACGTGQSHPFDPETLII